MSVSWQFYRFDYSRYLALRPVLRAAELPEEFMALPEELFAGSENAVTDAIIQALNFGEIDHEQARNALVQTLCCPGQPLQLDPGLIRAVAALAHARGTEDLGELLQDLLSGRLNLELWLSQDGPLLGFLTPEQTVHLHMTYSTVFRAGGKSRKKRRRGGLLGKVSAFVRQLLALEMNPEESLILLGELIASAAERNEGVAVTAG